MWIFVYKTISSFPGSVILRNWPLKFPIVLDATSCRKCRICVGKCLKISQKLHRCDGKHNKAIMYKIKSSKSTVSYFSPLYQLPLSISQNRPVRLVPFLLEYITYATSFSLAPNIEDFQLPLHLTLSSKMLPLNIHWWYRQKKEKKPGIMPSAGSVISYAFSHTLLFKL